MIQLPSGMIVLTIAILLSAYITAPASDSSCGERRAARIGSVWHLECISNNCDDEDPDTECQVINVENDEGTLEYQYCGCSEGSEGTCCHLILSYDAHGQNGKPDWSGSCQQCPGNDPGTCKVKIIGSYAQSYCSHP